ncbi:hypothetical protein LTR10_022699 [Elasticomyces elasticus]|uniref:Uncharacterized protein n=1 Tax=Exophiala sideris TaxID=1016849 RepID=A0ABR0JLT6_9EURO|nr:hypothetical protein LTR10_022699 [Elasticomyces elasticus]KAK5036571.1 hypothetical protein LTS07_002298 [Exophiala sideris]KAK5041599.1 hypothetical protein LTR13_002266 [Exophiala sideris]KAK5066954.1 hypothetical protein LTR69_002302 [Exophiala sideris]KAK5185013.1 hypothetical protein LTR44_002859 [Eurotiomycetes sp. CCFEE 6388]
MDTTPSSGTQTPSSTVSSGTTATSVSASSQLEPPSTITRKARLDFSRLQDLFSTTDTSSNPSARSPLWYILTTAVLLSFHKEKLVGDLWTYLASDHDTHQSDDAFLAVARRIREACLKASTLVGFPRAINALFSLKTALDTTHPSVSTTFSSDTSLRSSLDPSAKYDRGMSFFRQIYQKHTSRVLATMDTTSGGDLTHFAINCIYGELLSEHSIIGGLDTGLLEFVCCLADGCGPQAKGHFFGSLNLGASNETLRSSIQLTGNLAQQLHVPCPWQAEDVADEFQFLDKVMQP